MCTLTLITDPVASRSTHRPVAPTAHAPLLRLMMNRDELRTRPRAMPPSVHTVDHRSILMPVDPVSQGTWIGINDRGIFAAILNLTEPDPLSNSSHVPLSRGVIIPSILRYDTLDRAVAATQELTFSNYAPFRLLVGSIDGLHILHSRARTIESMSAPLFLTSSGLGDHLVEPPRARLFAQTLALDPSPTAQSAFHHHVFPDKRHFSVLMDRAEAQTVSITTLEMSSAAASMHYQDFLTGVVSSSALTLAQPTETGMS